MNNFIETIFIHELMSETLSKLAKHYVKKDVMSKDEFFYIQIKVFKKLKKQYDIKDELNITTTKTSEKVKNDRKRS